MKKHKILICLLIIILIAVTLTACKPKEVETENNNNVDSSFVSDVLCAKPVAPNGNETKILDSYTDNKYNYYLLDAGYIKNVFISTLAQVEYTGAPISFSKSITSTSQVAKSLTETVSNSYYFSNSYSEKTSIAAEETFKAGFDGLGVEFTAKQGLEWEWSESSSQTTTKSAANTSETVKIYSDAQTVSYSFGVNMAAKGRYRYAIYSDCDVYYRVKTSTDRQTLYGIDVDVCARVEDYFIRSEYSKDGNFKVKVDDDIVFADDFYKNLPPTTNSTPTEIDKSENDYVNFGGGNGSALNPYIISNKKHFTNIATYGYVDKNFKLSKDINLGDWDNAFTFYGSLDGNGNQITYYQNVDNNKIEYGLFKTLKGAKITNLKLNYIISANKKGRDIYVGGLASVAKNNANISKILVNKNSDVFVDTDGKSFLGGIIGLFEGGVIEQCANEADLWLGGKENYIGGIVGHAVADTNNIVIANCYNTGKITAQGYGWTTTYGNRVAGGIVGVVKKHDARTINIKNCYNDSYLKVLYSTTNALAYRSKGAIVGGHWETKNIFLNNCYFNSSKENIPTWNATTHSGVIGKKDLTCGLVDYNNWSDDIWIFNDAATPQLKWIVQL